ncbi:TM119 protein, partial [Alcedo cyanopectus]|nr:TM119 protein [Ceyx cyanopectus]
EMAAKPARGSWLLLLLAVPAALSAAPRLVAGLPDGGGSGDGEEASAAPPTGRVTPGVGPTTTTTEAAGTTVTNSSAPGSVLDGLVGFFKEYLLLVVVVGSLAFVLLFIVCAAAIVRQKHKASAYYPASFPKKKYVDQRDKAGGTRAFDEVPEKAPDPGAEEPREGSRQLQEDILAVAQTLRSPPKVSLANGAREEQKPPAEEKEEEDEEEGNKKPRDEQPAEPRPQKAGAVEAAGAA